MIIQILLLISKGGGLLDEINLDLVTYLEIPGFCSFYRSSTQQLDISNL